VLLASISQQSGFRPIEIRRDIRFTGSSSDSPILPPSAQQAQPPPYQIRHEPPPLLCTALLTPVFYDSSRIAHNDGKWWNIPADKTARPDDSPPSDRDPFQDHRLSAYPGIFANMDLAVAEGLISNRTIRILKLMPRAQDADTRSDQRIVIDLESPFAGKVSTGIHQHMVADNQVGGPVIPQVSQYKPVSRVDAAVPPDPYPSPVSLTIFNQNLHTRIHNRFFTQCIDQSVMVMFIHHTVQPAKPVPAF
jgi:hypothetical protein